MKKKAMTMRDLLPLALLFVVTAIGISIGADVINSVYSKQTANSYASNVSVQGLTGMTTLGQWLPTIALVLAAAVVIGILVSSFMNMGSN